MASAVITIADAENGQLNITVELDPPIQKEEQVDDARAVASLFLQWLQERLGS